MSQQPRRITPGSKYTVQPGDTLWDIAQRAYDDPEDWDTIYDANKQVIGNNPNLIKPGQVLQIPSQSDPGKRQPVPPTHPPTTHPPTTPPPTTPPPTPPPTTSPPSPKPDSDNWFDTHVEDPLEKGIKKIFGEKEDS